MSNIKALLLILLLIGCTKQQCPEVHHENMILKKTVQNNASQIIFMQGIISDQHKTIKRMKK
jgi:hypothetical protein